MTTFRILSSARARGHEAQPLQYQGQGPMNADCRVTTIQKLLGHQWPNSTMVFARLHDHTATEDYYAATERMTQRLLVAPSGDIGSLSDADHLGASVIGPEREQLLAQCPFGQDQASALLPQLSWNIEPARSQQELETKYDLLVSLSV